MVRRRSVWDLLDELEQASEELVESVMEDLRAEIHDIVTSHHPRVRHL
jgi:hypothetical protein